MRTGAEGSVGRGMALAIPSPPAYPREFRAGERRRCGRRPTGRAPALRRRGEPATRGSARRHGCAGQRRGGPAARQAGNTAAAGGKAGGRQHRSSQQEEGKQSGRSRQAAN
ncbi:hypothetical protein [Oryza sativa Japonica Group]|uniref:Uncharacterized protein n=2 Tax=Oryza sativa subsp. japonica TaxID=39947 RepID=Q8LRH0_ORYSJ|nr:hypothetical protein [Oryza sativa Japonica Group]